MPVRIGTKVTVPAPVNLADDIVSDRLWERPASKVWRSYNRIRGGNAAMSTPTRFAAVLTAALCVLPLCVLPAQAQPNGAELYARACAQCHESSNPEIRAPRGEVMRTMTPEAILRALESGSMRLFAQQLSASEKTA